MPSNLYVYVSISFRTDWLKLEGIFSSRNPNDDSWLRPRSILIGPSSSWISGFISSDCPVCHSLRRCTKLHLLKYMQIVRLDMFIARQG